MTNQVNKLIVTGVYNRFDFSLDFQPGLNIIFGKNGTGKTTLLHILANALNGDFSRFNHLDFHDIEIYLSNKKKLRIEKKGEEINVKFGQEKIYPPSQPEQMKLFLENKEDVPASFFRSLMLAERGRMLDRNPERKWTILPEEILRVAYFPAFRTMIEAWIAASDRDEERHEYLPRSQRNKWQEIATRNARNWFGRFTPIVDFPSIIDIESQLSREISRARQKVWRQDQIQINDSYQKIFASLSQTEEIDQEIQSLLTDIHDLFIRMNNSKLQVESRINYNQLRNLINPLESRGKIDKTALRILCIFRDWLDETVRVREISFQEIETYFTSVNKFLDGKKLDYNPEVSPRSTHIKFDDGFSVKGLRALSSGERQIVTLIYAATHMSEQEVVLIDEPEISLHVDWQRKMISRMSEQFGNRQIIACTHSPVIMADHLDSMQELNLSPTKKVITKRNNENNIDEIEEEMLF